MYKLGIDVGGTNTDAVLVDENRAVVADIKYPTSADIYDGILGAMRTVLEVSGVDPAQIHQAMLGTTQCTNAIVERKNLGPHRYPAHRRACHHRHPPHGGLVGGYSEGGRGQHHYRRRL